MKTEKFQRGASILEFLIIVPVLLILSFTAIEFGGIFTRWDTVHKSVQDAARYLSAVADNKNNTDTQKAIAANLVKYGSVNSGTQLLPGTYDDPVIAAVGGGEHISVSVVYHHTPIAGQALSNLLQLIGSGPLDLSVSLQASSVMRYVE